MNGFTNLGNTCYMNSVLQCLKNTIPLSEYFIVRQLCCDNNLVNTYIELVQECWSISKGIIRPLKFKFALGKSNELFRGSSQHDAQELLVYLLDTIHESIKINNKSIVSDLFYGKYKQTICCPNCENKSITYQPFIDMQLELVGDTLDDCLNKFTEKEILDNDNKWTCNKCKENVQAIKKMDIDVKPNYLIVSLKRFDKHRKLNKFIDVPLNNFNVDGTKYKLYATINHFGGKNGGHYTSCIKRVNGNWYNANDSNYQQINNKKHIINKSNYILFFLKN